MEIIRLLILISAILILSCSPEAEQITPQSKYDRGVFVVNQGNFGSGTGTLTFYDGDTILEDKAYQLSNAGLVLGNVAQSMTIVNDKLFVAINNGGKYVVARQDDLQFIREVGGLAQPRYFAEGPNDFLYLSEWGADGVSGKIHKINLLDGSLLNSETVLGGPEEMIVVDDALWICKSGGFGSDSLLLEYSLQSDNVVNSYVVGHNPVNVIRDKVGTLWVLCTGLFDFSDPNNNTAGSLVQFDNGQIIESWSLSNGVSNLAHDSTRDLLYFNMDGQIMRFDMKSGNDPEPFYPGFFFGLEVDEITGNVYAADAKDFVSRGEVLILSTQGNLIDSFQAGVIPGYIYVND